MTREDLHFMHLALREAKKAFDKEEIPVGAILVEKGKILAKGYNTREKSKNPLDHAELVLLRKVAKKRKNWRLNNTSLYVTLEPCPMCLGALLQARVGRLVYGCNDPKRQIPNPNIQSPTEHPFPSVKHLKKLSGNNHTLEITGGIMEKKCAELLKRFFKLCRGGVSPPRAR